MRIPRHLPYSGILLLLAAGCAGYFGHRDVVSAITSGQYKPAIAAISESIESDENAPLSLLNLGMLQRLDGDYQSSNSSWLKAKKLIAELRPTSVTESTASFVLNDNSISYTGSYLEQQWLHIFLALNFLNLNDLQAARVEMLQADQLHREFGEDNREPAFMRYLAGMIFEQLGEADQALVAYRKAITLYQKTRVPDSLYTDTARMLARLGQRSELRQLLNQHSIELDSIKANPNISIIWLQGLVSQKAEKRITRWDPELKMNFSIALPYYPPVNNQPNQTQLKTTSGTILNFELVSNIDNSIRQEFAATELTILAKTLARQVLKAKLGRSLIDRDGGNRGTANLVISLFNILSESADVRSWNSLPYRVLLYRGKVEPGSELLLNDLTVSIKNEQKSNFYSIYLSP